MGANDTRMSANPGTGGDEFQRNRSEAEIDAGGIKFTQMGKNFNANEEGMEREWERMAANSGSGKEEDFNTDFHG